MKRNLKHWYMTWALMLGLVAGVWAQSAEKFTSVQLAAKAEDMGKQTFKRKSGEVLTFQQIRELPNTVRKIVLNDEMSEAEYEVFDKYMESRTVTAEANLKETEKGLAAAEAESAKILEDSADKIRKILAITQKLGISFNTFSEYVGRINDRTLKAGLSKKDADFLRSLLQRPELFEK